jgi:hypothetical protein
VTQNFRSRTRSVQPTERVPIPITSTNSDRGGCECPLQTVDKRQKVLFLAFVQDGEAIVGRQALAVVSQDRVSDRLGAAVVKEAGPDPGPPQRRRPHLLASGGGLRDPVVEASHVVNQEIREREEVDFVERRDLVGTGPHGWEMAIGAADSQEYDFPKSRATRHGTSGWWRQERRVVGELHYRCCGVVGIGQSRVRDEQGAIAPRGVLVREKRGRDAHLVEEGVAGEGGDRADLTLPSEPTDSRLTAENIGQDQCPAGRFRSEVLLELGEILEKLVGHGVDQSEAEQRSGAALGHDVGLGRHDLTDKVDAVEQADPLGMEQLAVELGEGVEYAVDDLAIAGLERVAAAADRALVVALGARRIVEYGPKTLPRGKLTLEGGLAGLEAGQVGAGDLPRRSRWSYSRPLGGTTVGYEESVFLWQGGQETLRRSGSLARARRGEHDDREPPSFLALIHRDGRVGLIRGGKIETIWGRAGV